MVRRVNDMAEVEIRVMQRMIAKKLACEMVLTRVVVFMLKREWVGFVWKNSVCVLFAKHSARKLQVPRYLSAYIHHKVACALGMATIFRLSRKLNFP